MGNWRALWQSLYGGQRSDFTPTSQVIVRKRSECVSLDRRNRCGGSWVEREEGKIVRSGIIQNIDNR